MRDSTKEMPIKSIYNANQWPEDGPEDTYAKWYNSVIEKVPSELSSYDVVECLIKKRFVETAIETGIYYLMENVLAGEYPGSILIQLSELDRDILLPYADTLKDVLIGAHSVLSVPADNNDVWHGESIKQMFNSAVLELMSIMGYSAENLIGCGVNTDIGSGWKISETAAVEERTTWCSPVFDSEGKCQPEFRRYLNSIGLEYITLYGDDRDYWKYDAPVTSFHNANEILYGDNGLYNAVRTNNNERVSVILSQLNQAPKDIIMPGELPACVTTAEQILGWQTDMAKVRDLLKEEYFTVYCSLPVMEPDKLSCILDDMEEEYVIFFDTTAVEKDPSIEPAAKEAIRLCTDRLANLKRIFVYNEDMDKTSVMNLFGYPMQKGIDVRILANHYKMRKGIESIREKAHKDET